MNITETSSTKANAFVRKLYKLWHKNKKITPKYCIQHCNSEGRKKEKKKPLPGMIVCSGPLTSLESKMGHVQLTKRVEYISNIRAWHPLLSWLMRARVWTERSCPVMCTECLAGNAKSTLFSPFLLSLFR